MARARPGAGPGLIEARTHRLTDHRAEDSATYRRSDEAREWREQGSLPRARRRLAEAGISAIGLDQIEADAAQRVEQSVARVRELPDAGPNDLGLAEVLAP